MLFNLEKSFFQTSGKDYAKPEMLGPGGERAQELLLAEQWVIPALPDTWAPVLDFSWVLQSWILSPCMPEEQGCLSLSCWFCQNFFPENKELSSSKAAFSPEQSWLG